MSGIFHFCIKCHIAKVPMEADTRLTPFKRIEGPYSFNTSTSFKITRFFSLAIYFSTLHFHLTFFMITLTKSKKREDEVDFMKTYAFESAGGRNGLPSQSMKRNLVLRSPVQISL